MTAESHSTNLHYYQATCIYYGNLRHDKKSNLLLCSFLKNNNVSSPLIDEVNVKVKNSEALVPDCDDLYSKNITEEQIQHIFSQIPFLVVSGPLFGAAITALLLFDYIEPTQIYIWITLVFVSYSSFLFLWARYKKTGTSIIPAEEWGKKYLILSWISAASWGSASLLLFSDDIFVAQMILAMAVMSGAAAITVATIVYRPVFYTMLCLIVPLTVQFLLVGDTTHYIFALGFFGFTMILFFINASVNQVVEQSFRLRFSNEKLTSELKSKKEIAEESSMAKSNFLAVASHDLRQPLHAHGLFLGELRERLPDGVVINNIVDKLDSSLQVIAELFDSLLDISRLEAGVIETDIQDFFIDDALKPIIDQYRVKAEASGLTLRAVLPHYAINSDRILLSRILRNLLENAVCYTSKGKILLGCRRQDDTLLIQVWDTGCGITKTELKNIFKDYYQIKHKNNQKKFGLGLGLAVVSQLSKLLGHVINVKSVIGRGSVFTIEVPLSEAVNVLNQDTNPDAYNIDGLTGMNVLVIDDDESVRISMSGILDAWKCNVVTGSDGEDAINKLPPGYIPDAILADYQLNDGKTGPQEIKVLNAKFNQDISAAIITGDISSVNIALDMDMNLYPVLQKPVSPAKLCTLLRYIRSKN
ncbi:Chemotaxis protein methyltransferase CheR [hydrothermal vent metagenome]|uniref:histidine kinase n=1 Tax=hydrothermal vent metagenome TaxID=652676 RepID=A0A3B0WQT3_9ZZZZ